VNYEVGWIQCKCGNKEERNVTQVNIFAVFDAIIAGVILK
jgi:hypothetical protein